MVLIPLFWTAAGIRGATATVALVAAKAVEIALFWTGAAIWRATFERRALVKVRDAIVGLYGWCGEGGRVYKGFGEGEESTERMGDSSFFFSLLNLYGV